MRRLQFLTLTLLPTLTLAACVDTTGLTEAIHQDPHPSTSAAALVTVEEFADLQCPACRAAQAQVVEPLIAKYGKKIAYEFRHFPLSGHRYGMEAAEASECAADQGKFWEFVDHTYKNQDDLSSDVLRDWAEELGLDVELFDRCVQSHIKRKNIQASYDEGRSRNVGGTPTFFVNGNQTKATVADLSAAIDAFLSQGSVLQ